MRILFIRHAEAVEAGQFNGPDLGRPLTKKGGKTFVRVARCLAKTYPKPDIIISSEAMRARQTAGILAQTIGVSRVAIKAEMNPGAKKGAIQKVIRAHARKKWITLVGHEPDFSNAISSMVASGKVRLKLKKGGVAEVEKAGAGPAILRALYDPTRPNFIDSHAVPR